MSAPKLNDLQIEARLQILETAVATIVAQTFQATHGTGAYDALTKYRQELWDLMGGLRLTGLPQETGKALQAEMRDAHDHFYRAVQTFVGKE